LSKESKSKRKVKGRKFLFSQNLPALESKELIEIKGLKMTGKLLGGNQKNFRLSILKTRLRGQKLK
jgi:hypothetical protein